MIGRVVVANRGEIACRIIAACHEAGMPAVAIYGPGEEDARHVRLADDAYRIGEAGVTGGETLPYLRADAIIDVARRSGADAIHPGYGFLAENAAFAAACEGAGIVFVGPPAEAIAAMGDKVRAREIARVAGVPIVPGTADPVPDAATAARWAAEHGYPIALKASGGGGGRGFRIARDEGEVAAAFEGASGEATRYFANPAIYVERYIDRPRHIEVQVFADGHGAVVSLGERECSIQRRHQKLVEESPSPAVSPDLRRRLDEAAVALTRAVDYRGAGTIEFLLDAGGAFYFLEMNTRIQVEHPVTEIVTGIDLVAEQLGVAMGRPLSFGQGDIVSRGHAIECRVNAEDPGRDFRPVPGHVTLFRPPMGIGVRVDAAIDGPGEIRPEYDSMIAKVIAHGRDRAGAVARMARALAETTVEGVPTTLPFHRLLMAHPAFGRGETTTAFLTDFPEVLPPPADAAGEPGGGGDAAPEYRQVVVEVGGRRLTVWVRQDGGSSPPAAGARRPVRTTKRDRLGAGTGSGADPDEPTLPSPVQGTVVRVLVETGETVEAGQGVCVVEAMKMENTVAAHRPGTITAVLVEAGAGGPGPGPPPPPPGAPPGGGARGGVGGPPRGRGPPTGPPPPPGPLPGSPGRDPTWPSSDAGGITRCRQCRREGWPPPARATGRRSDGPAPDELEPAWSERAAGGSMGRTGTRAPLGDRVDPSISRSWVGARPGAGQAATPRAPGSSMGPTSMMTSSTPT
ncbi:MAG: biotin carboxylase N-terminal domain-containing protein [Thermomicrobiales bacterium]